ncbi:class I SAM-dependent methyltransferase [Micromonospora sp. STR1s_5]|nr:class I SAM-dependent methyltransferase [Micromonospora sp. STR1s_5]
MNGVQQIRIDELDGVLDQADQLIHSDYAAAMALLGSVSVDIAPPRSADPFSRDYSEWVMTTYRDIAEIDEYRPSINEADTNVAVDIPLDRYFPYSTHDLDFIGRYLTGVGMILSALKQPPGSRIVEYGVGWAHVSAALARAGYDVTCVDIEPKFLQLARRQAESVGCTVATHHGRFGERPFPPDAPKADAVVFFEAFHHAFEHLEVLRRLRKDVLRPGGVLVLAAEPVHPGFPYPWGIRPDGHALWAVRRHKWMELGFQEDYLLRALAREGFVTTRTRLDALGSFGLLYRAQLHEGTVRLGETLLPADEAASWAPLSPAGEPRRFAQMNSRVTLDADPEWASISVTMVNYLTIPLAVGVDAGGAGPVIRRVFAPGERAIVPVPLPATRRELRVWSETAIPARLGINNDQRSLGISVEELSYHAA